MKTSITGKNVIKEMKDLAKGYFAEYGNPSCVCVGVSALGRTESSGRARDAQERKTFVGISGDTGRKLLRATLNAEGHGGGTLSAADVTARLTTMANQHLVTYRSRLTGPAIVSAETWATHNCAEGNLALYLLMNGVRANVITIASYEIIGNSVQYKPLCKQCQQWVRQHFKVLEDFDAHTKGR
ncbi:hypothetical protein [Pseudomonas sp. 5P_5.1_Bac1]|uniref:hypothetical protein n=1 Tax=Pseudomonas sp. 5P_5.1_Bac1 TaxID=2971616 RepID=UPI0021C7A01E|nr:hypothetical protein [Pseudomonas sp. 5P_5.1_Bac1]MCU1720298.1 hypothetical protein [Pseudomonas sp. 5P_5.1_Bac1]